MRCSRPSASRTCCTTCSTSPSTTSRRSSGSRPRRRGNWRAARAGNFSALLALLDPEAALRADAAAVAMGGAAYWQNVRLATGIEGADAVARTFLGRARAAQPAFIDGAPGAVWIHEGEVRVAFRFGIANDRIVTIDLVADRAVLAHAVIER